MDPQGPEVAADWGSLGSGETYLGYRRTDGFASPGGLMPNEARSYDIPGRLRRNHWALSGDWTATPEAVVLNEPNGRIARRFEARDVHLVMGPPARGSSVRFRVFIDGQPPGEAAGSDIDAGWVRRAHRTTDVPTDPPTRSHHRSSVRDRVPRSPERRDSHSRSADRAAYCRGTEGQGRASVVIWVVLSSS